MRTSTNVNKATIFKAILLLLFVLSSQFGLAQCNASIKVDQDRNVRSTKPTGTYYKMEITNKGKSADTFSLSTVNVNAANASNNDGSSNAKNVVLNVEFLDSSQNRINDIKVNPGETVSFFAHIVVPTGTPFDRWSSTQVIAKSKICSNYKVDTLLRTLTINPKEE